MATVTHYIVSHYDVDVERRSEHTGQAPEKDPWQNKPSFSAQRWLQSPQFVPAKNLWSSDETSGPSSRANGVDHGNAVAGWYKSKVTKRRHSISSRNESDTHASRPTSTRRPETVRKTERRDKNNWFIMRAIQSEEAQSPTAMPTSTLADILARDPPPSSTEEKFTPPVWITLGPSNRGFAMLQQSGWNEGEGLGTTQWGKEQLEEVDLDPNHNGEVIDLTNVGDSDDEFVVNDIPDSTHSNKPYARKALLTPLPTILKSDKLGIGLKAKTYGPYKASQKRVTHNAAALAAHIKAREDAREKRLDVGHGKRAFEKVRKQEEEKRRRMLAYMNE